jgi:uncharacterized protein (DUF924 family)
VEDTDSILAFWFGRDANDASVAKAQSSLWWSKKPETDQEIRRRFGTLVLEAESGELDGWQSSIEGRLALILLTDQFPRNIYRDTPAAFRFDGIARRLCLEALASRSEKNLRPIHRVFFYLPLEHSEKLEHQNRSVELFRELAAGVSDDLKPTFGGFVDYALRHQAIIERFGRFPHRNSILGRSSTAEEIEFLKQPGSSF